MAHWIEHERLFSGRKYECSECGRESDRPYGKCPHCGESMGGKGEYRPDFVDECAFMDMLG